MSGAISFFPWTTTNAENSFSVETVGATQGFIFDDPVINPTQIAAAVVDASNTAPLFGGLPLQILLTAAAGREAFHSSALLAATNADINGFCTFTYAENGIVVPGSDNVPLYGVGGTCNYVALGSRARLVLQASSALVDSLSGVGVNTQISWNFTTGMADVYNSTTGALPITNIAGVYIGNALVAEQISSTWKFRYGNAIAVTV